MRQLPSGIETLYIKLLSIHKYLQNKNKNTDMYDKELCV